MPNGAQALIRTLVDAGVDTCFTNPGTSEIHFVAALDSVPEMRAILTLFEGVATGAADGYARMADAPAATLLHLGPGLGNGLANLHNARRARVPVVNIVGDHATYHAQYDPPLQSDIETVARNVSGVGADIEEDRRARSRRRRGDRRRHRASRPGGNADRARRRVVAGRRGTRGAAPAGRFTRGLGRDHRGGREGNPRQPPDRDPARREALRERGLLAAARIAAATGDKAVRRAERDPPGTRRRPARRRAARLLARARLEAARRAGASDPGGRDSARLVFRLPGQEELVGARLVARCTSSRRRPPTWSGASRRWWRRSTPRTPSPRCNSASVPPRPEGPLTAEKVCQAIGAILPEGAILSDEAITSALALPANTAGAPRHDWLTLTGGAIGQGLPVAVGAAIACPDRPVIALEADGSALYTIQSLWTMAREQLDVTVVIFNNRAYADPRRGARAHRRGRGRSQSQGAARAGQSGPRFRRARHRARRLVAPCRHCRTAHGCP